MEPILFMKIKNSIFDSDKKSLITSDSAWLREMCVCVCAVRVCSRAKIKSAFGLVFGKHFIHREHCYLVFTLWRCHMMEWLCFGCACANVVLMISLARALYMSYVCVPSAMPGYQIAHFVIKWVFTWCLFVLCLFTGRTQPTTHIPISTSPTVGEFLVAATMTARCCWPVGNTLYASINCIIIIWTHISFTTIHIIKVMATVSRRYRPLHGSM